VVEIDVALVPQVARPREAAVFVVVDQIRATTTLVTLIDLGCEAVYIEGSLVAARRLARATNGLLIGERHLRKPAGFDFGNSPTTLVRAGVHGRSAVLSTTNGTWILRMLRGADHVLAGCLRNARACAEAALRIAVEQSLPVRVVCSGRSRRFVIEDAVAAGEIVRRIRDAAQRDRIDVELTDGATTALRLADSYPDALTALQLADGGRTLRSIGEAVDIPYCAEVDVSSTVPGLQAGLPMRISALPASPSSTR
jgi:2-phosphosulfolactate phosphatase